MRFHLDIKLKNRPYPLYRQIADAVREKIESGEYPVNYQLPPETAFSETLGVNHLTLRRALKQLEQEGYIYKIRGSGSYVAEKTISEKIMPGSVSRTIGISFPEVMEDSELYVFYRSAVKYLYAHDYKTLRVSYISPSDELRHIRHNLDLFTGIIFHPSSNPYLYKKNIETVISTGVPVVLAGAEAPELTNLCDCVYCDQVKAVDKVISHICGKGFSDIYFFDYHEHFDSPRFSGYKQAIKKKGLDENLILLDNNFAHNVRQDAYDSAMKFFRRRKSPAAIMALNDSIAAGINRAIKELKLKAPDEVLLFGFGNDDSNPLRKKDEDSDFPTVDIGREKMGEAAAKLIIDRINNKKRKKRKVLVPSEIIFNSAEKKAIV